MYHALTRLSTTRLLAKKPSAGERFYCTSCGVEHINWMGKCSSCGEWNTIKPFRESKENTPLNHGQKSWLHHNNPLQQTMVPLNSIATNTILNRLVTPSNEMNRVLGGGLVQGSVVLVVGEPGAGKSTMILQLASMVNEMNSNATTLYVSGEETKEQIASRAHRLKLNTESIFVHNECNIDNLVDSITALPMLPKLVIIDSIQTMYTTENSNTVGSIGQIRDSTAKIVQFAKSTGVTVILIGHVTKSGDVAGPRILEHMVDTVISLEGNDQTDCKLLRTSKNRFGSTAEIGVFLMTSEGLKDVSNPSQIFMTTEDGTKSMEGSSISVILEGTRPLLAEIQCLVSTSFSAAQIKSTRRTIEGYSPQRLLLISAVLEKHLKLKLSFRDLYVNVVGRLKIADTAADLALAVSITSSYLNLPVVQKTVFFGEIGLGGELRHSRSSEARCMEAINLGYSTVICPPSKDKRMIKVNPAVKECKYLHQALNVAFDAKDIHHTISEHHMRSRFKQKSIQPRAGMISFESDDEDYSDD